MKVRARRLLRSARGAALIAALGGAASGAAAAETEVRLTQHPDKSYEVSGLFTVDASTAIVWDVITDYDHIPSFVSSMRSSRVRETRDDGALIVEQKAVGAMFFLSKTMRILLNVRQTPERLRFTDIGHEDFAVYDGDWEVRKITVGSSVNYHLLVAPNFLAPSFIMNRAMKAGARNLLDQVRAEMIRRALAK
ncbi:MAG: SRPBCC family protein [Elusimicrobiota bacterium]